MCIYAHCNFYAYCVLYDIISYNLYAIIVIRGFLLFTQQIKQYTKSITNCLNNQNKIKQNSENIICDQ